MQVYLPFFFFWLIGGLEAIILKFIDFLSLSLRLQIVVHKNSPRGTHFRRAGPRQRVCVFVCFVCFLLIGIELIKNHMIVIDVCCLTLFRCILIQTMFMLVL